MRWVAVVTEKEAGSCVQKVLEAKVQRIANFTGCFVL
jgi:hypothetical protein